MSRFLPPLNGVRAFEAAARHLSFTRAADELNVTQAAISHQVKALEDRLNVRLFKRLNRALMLTDEGQRYYPQVRDALDALANATENLVRSSQRGSLTVSVVPSFASLWLVPRIHDFRSKHPEINIRVSADDKVIDFVRDDVDVALRSGKGGWANLYYEKFLDEEVFPVCSPRLLENGPPIRHPEDLEKYPLLIDYVPKGSDYWDWESWMKAAGVKFSAAKYGAEFSHSYMVVQAAIAGEGIALGRTGMIKAELESGRLVKPLDLSFKSANAYYFVCPFNKTDDPRVLAFKDWIFEQVGDSPEI